LLHLQEGDFVWCAFPERENPCRPGPLHLGYTLMVSGGTDVTGLPSALMAYTTSRPWPPDVACPLGVFVFDRATAAGFGQSRGFVMDLRRLAFVPLALAWFPRLHQPNHGIQGRAAKPEQRRFRATVADLMTRHGEIVERLGPVWPTR
jgi:hypothetical protein